MSGLTCDACNKEFLDNGEQKLHYKSDWHGYNLKCKEAELEEFYDYSSSYVDESGKKLIVADDMSNIVELGSGSELVLTRRRSDQEITTKILGYREYLRYYRQKPQPSPANKMPTSVVLASRHRSMALATLRSREQLERMKEKRAMERWAIRAMQRRIRSTRICPKLSRHFYLLH